MLPFCSRRSCRGSLGLRCLLLGVVSLLAGSAHGAIRVVSYNTLDNPTNAFEDGLVQTIFDAIGTKPTNGIAKRADIIAVQEQTTFASETTASRIADALNSLYGVGSYTSALTGLGGDRVGVVYDTATVSLIGSTNVATSGPRQAFRGQFRPVGYTSPDADLYVYSAHFKAGSSSSDESTRALEGLFLRNNADALGPDANVVFAGDFNFGDNGEAGYLNLLGGNGNTNASDPIDLPFWPSPIYAEHMTQSTRTSGGDGAGGGMDDRFDLQITSDDLLDGEGLSYIGPTSTGLGGLDHSYQAFGNDGTSYNQAITFPSTGRSQPANVLQALHDFSDHLPVVADYQLPAWMDVVVSAVPTEVELGESVNVDVMIENIANVLSANAADELDYTVTVSGDLLIGGDPMGEIVGFDPATGGAQTEQIELDTSSPGSKSGTIAVISNSQAVQAGSFSMPISFSVVTPPVDADFDNDNDVDDTDLLLWDAGFQFGPGLSGIGDADIDGDADVADVLLWQQEYTGPLSSVTVVPEPAAGVAVLLALALAVAKRRR